jgi:hypothetical protein
MRSGRIYGIAVAAIIIIFASGRGLAAEKLRLAYVGPSLTLSLPWVVKETGILAKYDLAGSLIDRRAQNSKDLQ